MIYKEEQVFMNTIIRIQALSTKGTVFSKTRIREDFSCFAEVVRKFSRFQPDSELSQMNKSMGRALPVSPELFHLVKYALELAEISAGCFDPTIIDLLEMYGYDKKSDFSRLNDPLLQKEIAQQVRNRPGFREIELDEKNFTVKLAKNQRIDLGSIGKGYAIDLAYKKLSRDFEHFLINAGGDVRVSGLNEQGLPWKIMLYKAPLPNSGGSDQNDNSLGLVAMQPGFSIAGSGGWARRVGIFHHLLNPRNGIPINEISQCYVTAPTGLEADAWSTLLFVSGMPGLQLLEAKKYQGLIIDHLGNISKTADFEYSDSQSL